ARLPLPAIEAEILADAPDPADGPATRPSAPMRRRGLFAIAASSTLAGLTLAVVLLIGDGSSSHAPLAVGQVLRPAAATPASQPAEPPPGPGQYFYTRSRE